MAKILIYINLSIFVGLALINLLGVFMPELGFDALWYHLTLSKLFLMKHQWYIPGGLYYYSAMPRLAELIGLPFLALFGYIGPKFVQFVSGLIASLLIYRLAKRFTQDKLLSLAAVNLFYATWLVSWQSSSAYVDLVRTLFELSALFIILKSRFLNHKSIILTGLFMGLAIGVKWHALGTLALLSFIFTPAIIPTALLIASPWFLIAFHFTGNPLHPLFERFMTATQLSQVSPHFYAPLSILRRLVLSPVFLTKPADDFLSPVTGMVYLISFFGLISSNKTIRKVSLFGILGTFLLLLTPPPSTRYFLPYFPALIIVSVYILSQLKNIYSNLFVVIFSLSAFLIFGLRLYAFAKYLPYLSGKLSQNQFLASQSYRLPDTFIDADDYVKNNLSPNASYAISSLHNLYYFPYNFDHDSFVDHTKHYDYLVTTQADPSEVGGELIHTNPLGIQIFKL
ncbi:hypothetical protein HYU90_00255 [Candidatus Collierbacteria bacterium]|nr:hypothetical protein [Candidatus Collierbacteria bacterium]